MINISTSMLESVKEGVRLALLAAGSYGITYLLQYFNAMDQSEVSIATLTLVLRIVDKWLHETKVAVHGLTRV